MTARIGVGSSTRRKLSEAFCWGKRKRTFGDLPSKRMKIQEQHSQIGKPLMNLAGNTNLKETKVQDDRSSWLYRKEEMAVQDNRSRRIVKPSNKDLNYKKEITKIQDDHSSQIVKPFKGLRRDLSWTKEIQDDQYCPTITKPSKELPKDVKNLEASPPPKQTRPPVKKYAENRRSGKNMEVLLASKRDDDECLTMEEYLKKFTTVITCDGQHSPGHDEVNTTSLVGGAADNEDWMLKPLSEYDIPGPLPDREELNNINLDNFWDGIIF